MWFYVDRIWGPTAEIHYSDLYPRWYGSRELLLHGRDPYGTEVSREIQLWSYGHAVGNGEQKDEDRFAYPLYVAFLLAPTITLPFPQVVRLFRWILPLAAMISVTLWVSMLRWRCSRPLLGCLVLLSFGSFPVLESIYLQQPVLLAAAFLAAAGACLSSGRLWMAGSLLAIASIKPQLIVLLAPWLLFWAVSRWRARQRLIWGFAVTIILLVAASQILLPGWMREFLAGIVAYQRYTGNFSILKLLLGTAGSAIASVTLVSGLAVLSWKVRLAPATSSQFAAAFCLVLIVTVMIIPTLYPTNQVILLPAIFFLLRDFTQIWERGRAVRLALFASGCLIAWPWLGVLALMLFGAFEPLTQIRKLWLFPVSSLLLVPLSLLIVFSILTPALFQTAGASRRASLVHAGG